MRIAELLAQAAAERRPVFSCEFFPPKTADGEVVLWQTIEALLPFELDFVSLTYGAGGSTQEISLRVASRIIRETGWPTLAHLTCVGANASQLAATIDEFAAGGVENILALRGDPAAGPGSSWVTTPGGYTYAVELVAALQQRGGFSIGVAAFPEGHPESPDLQQDVEVLVAKARAGADFAITNLFFRAEHYFELVRRLRALDCALPVLPGLMPVTSHSQLDRFTALSGADFPEELRARFNAVADDPAAIIDLGVEVTLELSRELLRGGAPGIHLYTLNRSHSTQRILDRLAAEGLR